MNRKSIHICVGEVTWKVKMHIVIQKSNPFDAEAGREAFSTSKQFRR